MKINKHIVLFVFVFAAIFACIAFTLKTKAEDDRFITKIVDPKTEELKLYWKNDKNEIIKSLQGLATYVESKNKTLVFAMNGGMYMEDNAPLGLYIEDGKTIRKLNTGSGSGNFHLKPNGVFYITNDKIPKVCTTEKFKTDEEIKYATQSGPMLVVDGKIHTAFTKGSENLNIRNGVGILPDNKILFAMSKGMVNFYDFADFFLKQGCKNALYLDGFVSRTYLPEKNFIQKDGNFGVIIGVTKANKK
jgi:uncharacterized protein YigE (DUF2233 family)